MGGGIQAAHVARVLRAKSLQEITRAILRRVMRKAHACKRDVLTLFDGAPK